MISADAVAIEGEFARRLSLPGLALIIFIPFIGVGIYALAAILVRRTRNRWNRVAEIVVAYSLGCICIDYPHWVFERYSSKDRDRVACGK
jgi:hypothetical protein